MSRRLIGRITRAMAAGEEVDWEAVGRSGTPNQSQKIRNLQRIDRLWRSAAASPPSESSSSGRSGRDRWRLALQSLVALAALHVFLGVVGFWLAPGGALLPTVAAEMIAVPLFAATAAWLLVGGRRDPRAAVLGAAYLLCAAAFAHGSAAWAWGQLPVVGGWSLPRAVLPDAFLGLLLWVFVRRFPRVVRLSATDVWMEWGERASGAIGVTLFVANFLAVTLPGSLPSFFASLVRHPSSLYWLLNIGVSLPALVLMLMRTREAPKLERRRVTLLSAALVLGLGPMGVAVMAELLSPAVQDFLSAPQHRTVVMGVLFGFALTTPLSTAVCIKSQNVLPVRFVFHAAARYVLFTSSVTVGLIVPVVWLALFLYEGRSRPLQELLATSQGRGLVGAAAAAILLLIQREAILRSMRRLFLGPAHDWPTLLNSSGPLVRHARTPRELEDSLTRHMKSHAHLGGMLLMLRSRDGRYFEPVGSGAPLPADSALAEVVFARDGPLTVFADSPDDVVELLPAADKAWLEASRSSLIAPLIGQGGERLGLLAFGSNSEGLCPAPDEREFASALAGSVALGLERHPVDAPTGPGESTTEPALECEGCGRVVASRNGRCECGGRLQEVPLPRVLAERFKVKARLGRGGMGVVYRAQDLRLGRDVALKTLPRVSREATALLSAEARSMAGFQHPNVAFILDFQSWRGVPVLIVEYLAGGTLSDRLRREWSWKGAAELGLVICSALTAMHEAGVTHCDVKPSNIGFAADGTPKLLDLGLARMVAQVAEGNGSDYHVLDSSGETLSYLGGTPLYMSPEAIRGGVPDHRYDLWSLGVVLYELAAGRHPFQDRDAFVRALRRGRLPDVVPFTESRLDQPAASEFLSRVLHEDVARRPDTAAEFADSLRSTF